MSYCPINIFTNFAFFQGLFFITTAHNKPRA